jgi:hypothetical protein
MPKVVHVSDCVEGSIYVGRATRRIAQGSILGNPFKIGRDGDRSVVIEKYEDWLSQMLPQYPAIVEALIQLRNAPAISCWCRHDGEPRTDDNACHGDVLVELLERFDDDEIWAFALGERKPL